MGSMKHTGVVLVGLVLLFALAGCGQQPASQAPAQPSSAPPATQTAPAAAPAPAPQAAPTPVEPAPAPAPRTKAKPPAPAPEGKAEPPAPQPAQAPAPAAAPAPPPTPVVKTVVAGTVVPIEILDGASSKASRVGDAVRAKVVEDVTQDGLVVIPAGSMIYGEVTMAQALKTIGGQAKLALDFNRLELPDGGTALLRATISQVGKSETKKDAATIGGAAAAGALLGRLFSKDNKTKGTLIGAAVGAAAGTGIAAGTKGQEIEIPAGTSMKIKLDEPVQVTLRL